MLKCMKRYAKCNASIGMYKTKEKFAEKDGFDSTYSPSVEMFPTVKQSLFLCSKYSDA